MLADPHQHELRRRNTLLAQFVRNHDVELPRLRCTEHVRERGIDGARELARIVRRLDVRMRAADLRQARRLRLAIEDVELVRAQEREAAAPREAVPEFLDRDCSVVLASVREHIDHLAEHARPCTRERVRELVDETADDLVERGGGRVPVVQDRIEQPRRIAGDEHPVELELVDVPAPLGECRKQSSAMRRGCDQQRRRAALEAGGEEVRNGLRKLGNLAVDLDCMAVISPAREEFLPIRHVPEGSGGYGGLSRFRVGPGGNEAAVAYGLLFLRACVGLSLSAHGSQKLFGWFGGPGPRGTAGFFGSLGFRPPLAMALVAGASECAGVLFALGLVTPFAALAMASVMVVAVGSVHRPNGFFVTNGGYEYNLTIWSVAAAVAATGPGRFSLDHALGIAGSLSGLWWGVGVLAASLAGGALVLATRQVPPEQAAADSALTRDTEEVRA